MRRGFHTSGKPGSGGLDHRFPPWFARLHGTPGTLWFFSLRAAGWLALQ